MKVLLLGCGAREHAMAQSISSSKLCTKLYVAPGNGLINNEFEGIPSINGVTSFEKIKAAILKYSIDLVVSGGEEALVRGVYDYLKADSRLANVHIVGPDRAGAQLEGSKSFSKNFMNKYNIPTARYAVFKAQEIEAAKKYLRELSTPFVIKADGLAGGKGVLICESIEEGETALVDILIKAKFGTAGRQVIIEEFLNGVECSVFIATDGAEYMLLPIAKDYKKIGVGDTGLNTGGMGAISPVPFLDDKFLQKITNNIIQPTLQGLKQEKICYKGFVFFGIMKVKDEPYLLEYNIRLGDPEAECILARIKSDFLELLVKISSGDIKSYDMLISTLSSTTIVLVSEGYPEKFEIGKPIRNIPDKCSSIINYAGVVKQGNNVLTSSGRVLTITSLDKSLDGAIEKSLKVAQAIAFDNKYFRNDIGADSILS